MALPTILRTILIGCVFSGAMCVPFPVTPSTVTADRNTNPTSSPEVLNKATSVKTPKAKPESASLKVQSPNKKEDNITKEVVSLEKEGYIRNDGTYVLEDRAGVPCVMAYFKAKITTYYPTTKGEDKYQSVVSYPPDDLKVSGQCDRDNLVAVLNLKWDDGIFSLTFRYDDLHDAWFVGKFAFQFQTSTSKYKNAIGDKTVVVESSPKRRFWATSHARSFRCLLLHDVSMVDDDEVYSATVHFDEARVQALTRTANFKTPKHCIHRVHRNEMVPATVSGLLAGAVVLTISGYAVFRYFKVKKFQYDTME